MRSLELEGTISKIEPEKRLAFGWASVIKKDGVVVEDRQGDRIEDSTELEEGAYDFVLHSRDGGEQHIRKGVATLVESMVFTPEKLEALGLPPDSVDPGWWTGFKVHDDKVWDGIKKGEYADFSVHGVGIRESVSKLDRPQVAGNYYRRRFSAGMSIRRVR